jgi:hypothetical protein
MVTDLRLAWPALESHVRLLIGIGEARHYL